MSSNNLNIVSTAFSVCASLFFLIGLIGFSIQADTVKNVAWITVGSGSLDVWFGLKKARVESGSGNYNLEYGDSNCGFCDACDQDGKGAFGLLIIAFIFSIVTAVNSGFLSTKPTAMAQIGNVFSAFAAAVASIVGFGLFMSDCWNAIDANLSEELSYGPGSALVLLGLLMMWIVVFLQVGAAALSGTAPAHVPAAVPTSA